MDDVFILGPCSIENEKNYIDSLNFLYPIMKDKNWYFKASFDKANRTSILGERGPGLEEGLRIFKKAKEIFPDVKLITDVHEVWQIEKLIPYIDVIQIPAFLCRQTDLIVESAKHFNIINIKKGQWLGPDNIIKTVDKIKNTNEKTQAWLTDRGTAFGYGHLIVDFTIVDKIKNSIWDKFILDCTHSVQRSRSIYGVQGDVNLAKKYLLSYSIFGYDGVFVETHLDPQNAISDGDCQIDVNEISNLINKTKKIKEVFNG